MKPILVCLAVALFGIGLSVLNALVGVTLPQSGLIAQANILGPMGYAMMIFGITGTVFLSLRAVVHNI